MHVARREVALDRVAGSATCVIRGGMAPRWTEQLERLGSGCRIRPPTSRFVEIAEATVPGSGFPLTNQRSLRHVDPNFDFRQLF